MLISFWSQELVFEPQVKTFVKFVNYQRYNDSTWECLLIYYISFALKVIVLFFPKICCFFHLIMNIVIWDVIYNRNMYF